MVYGLYEVSIQIVRRIEIARGECAPMARVDLDEDEDDGEPRPSMSPTADLIRIAEALSASPRAASAGFHRRRAFIWHTGPIGWSRC